MFSRIASFLAASSARAPSKPLSHRRSALVRDRLRQFGADTDGAIAIIFAMIGVSLCLFVGAAVDLGRWLQARNQSVAALDAAVLAGARVLQLDEKDVTGARAAAQQYFTENTKGRMHVVDETVSFNPSDDNTAFTGTNRSFIETTFLSFAHISRLPVGAYSKAVLRAGGQSNNEVEIAMMLDVTGSMSGTKIRDLKAAATDLVNIVISDSANYNPVRISIVPFAEGVRLPTSANTKARGSPTTTITVGSGRNAKTYYRTDCVVERQGTNKYTDVAPGTNNYVKTMYVTSSSGVCGVTTDDTLMPLSKNKAALTAKIDSLDLSNTTAGHIGTAWAWYTLSPNWNTLWDASAAAKPYGDGTRKFAILMTDGEYNLQYDSNGVSGTGANGDSPTQAKALCAGMKAKGITVYTVGFALGGNQTAINTLSTCATDASTTYTADSGAELKQAFRDIALKINQLYLTQ
ncbi:pilus assembly protein [uncultured Hyphomicrobium sp.]|uniref:pilus assembly protein n=1 Tax=uncultured Hyphomicrobium sp. TaxID=194373 RepID=UPI0025DE34A9|nr:pilus assembly protein [uncultured Hyphomicrobium sp.]